ncbi:MAG: lipocalin family protein [Bacteroidales bacterium]|jgi:hypothetical protein|nr:lipocalin family protein [Bacteroidales bacterium]
MKTLNLFKWGCLLMVLLFTGCSKDDDETKIEVATLIGTWEMVSYRNYDKDIATGAIFNESQSTPTETIYVFKQDSYEQYYMGEIVETGSWSLEGKKLFIADLEFEVLKLNISELVLLKSSDRTTYLHCSEITFQRK